jgi:hypothetical protein
MTLRSTLTRMGAVAAVALLPTVLAVAPASAKGTPSNVTVTCDANVQSATVTVQLVTGLTKPAPASNQVVFNCTPFAKKTSNTIAPLSQPAAAFEWTAFVTGTGATFGCGGFTLRGSTATCTNAAGIGSGTVTIVAS